MHPFFNTAVFSHRNRTWVLAIIIGMLFGQALTLDAATGRWGNSLRTAARTAMQAMRPTPSTEREARAMMRDLTNPLRYGSRSNSRNGSSKTGTGIRAVMGLFSVAAIGGYAAQRATEHNDMRAAHWKPLIDAYFTRHLTRERMLAMAPDDLIPLIVAALRESGIKEDREDQEADQERVAYVLTKVAHALMEDATIISTNAEMVATCWDLYNNLQPHRRLLQPFLRGYIQRYQDLNPKIRRRVMQAAITAADTTRPQDLVNLLNRRTIPNRDLTTSEKHLKQLLVTHLNKAKREEDPLMRERFDLGHKMLMEHHLSACSHPLPELLDYVRAEESQGRIIGFHGSSETLPLMRDLFTRLYTLVAATDVPHEFRFFRFDRSTRTPAYEEHLAQHITTANEEHLPQPISSSTYPKPQEHSSLLLYFTLSLFAPNLGSAPLAYAALNAKRSERLSHLTLQSLFANLGIASLGKELDDEGILDQLHSQHHEALGDMGSLVTLSMTPAFVKKYAYAGVVEGKRETYHWTRGATKFSSSDPATIAQAMRDPRVTQVLGTQEERGLVCEEHCLAIPGALTNPEHARRGDIRIREFFPGLNPEAYARYEATRDEILSRVAYALLFPEGIPPHSPL